MFTVDSCLDVIGHTRPPMRTHHLGVGLAHHELLQILLLHECLVRQVVGMLALQLLQRSFHCRAINGLTRIRLIASIQLGQVISNVPLQLLLLALEPLEAQVLAA